MIALLRRHLPARTLPLAALLVWGWTGALGILLALPLLSVLWRAFQDRSGAFAGLDRFVEILSAPGIMTATGNSLVLSLASTAVTVPLAFAFAWALVRTVAPGRGLFRQIGLIPLLAPSLMPAISIIYLFGNQGLLRDLLGGASIYGFGGMLLGEVFYAFPHALLILVTALAVTDGRLYEAARCMGASPLRQFLTITLPGARYGLVSAALVVFTLVVTDFGVPKVVGGKVQVLAVEAYKQVVGQQNFERGAVVGLMLLLPAVLSFVVERRVAARQRAAMSARAVPGVILPHPVRDAAGAGVLVLVSVFLLALLLVAVAASFMRYWPYQMGFTLAHYDFDNVDGSGWSAWFNSLKMSAGVALGGTVLAFFGAVWTEKLPGVAAGRGMLRFLAMLPMAVPGLVLGLGYVFFFNAPGNPLHVLYGTLTLMTLCTIAHFYTTAHLTAVTALKQLDAEFDAVAASLKVPFGVTLWRVTLPVCLPALLDVLRFFFVSAMTTVSALVFLGSSDTGLAAVAIVTMDDAGDTAAAAAMATLVVGTSALLSVVLSLLQGRILRRQARWRGRRSG